MLQFQLPVKSLIDDSTFFINQEYIIMHCSALLVNVDENLEGYILGYTHTSVA